MQLLQSAPLQHTSSPSPLKIDKLSIEFFKMPTSELSCLSLVQALKTSTCFPSLCIVQAIIISCLRLNLLLLNTLVVNWHPHPHPIKQGDVSERREPTNCNSLCRRLLYLSASCLLPLAACRVSDARDIGFLGMRRKQKCCPILAIPDSDDYELRSEAADSQLPATDSMHSSC